MYNLSGLIIMTLFYGSYLCKQFWLRRLGIFTDQLGRGDKPVRTNRIETALKISTFSMAAVQIFSLSIIPKTYLLLRHSFIRFTGIGIAFLGTAVFIVAMICIKNNWRAGIDAAQRTALIKEGIYRFSRNPAFLGFDLFYIGLTLAFSNPLQILFTILCVVLLHLQILEEERFLPTVFGIAYEEYKQSTARYFLFL